MVLGPVVLPPSSVKFDTQTGEVVELLHVEALPEATHEAVLWVQAETHSPQDLCVFLTEVVEGVHQLLQVWVCVHHISCQDVVETVCGTRETLLQLLAPDELCHLEAQMIRLPLCCIVIRYLLF